MPKNGLMLDQNMKILIVSYDVRAASLAASYRARKFCKYLSLKGFDVVVLAAHSDPSLGGDDLQGCTLVQVDDNSRRGKFRFITTRIFGLPDPSIYWLKSIKALLKRRPGTFSDVDVIFVTSPPHGIQKVGLFLSEILRKPLVADFRDDFVTNHRIKWITPIHKISATILEKSVVASSKYTIANTDAVRARLAGRHGPHSDKVVTIPNGFDFDDNKWKSNNKENTSGCITYVGGAYGGFAVQAMECIAKQIAAHGRQKKWRIVTAGPGNWSVSEEYQFWHHYGLVDVNTAARLVGTSGCLILLMPPGEQEPSGTVPLKAYQYLASERPIVFFGERGSTTDLLSQFPGTFSFEREKIETIVDWFDANEKDFNRCYPRVEGFQYDFSLLTDSLAGLMRD